MIGQELTTGSIPDEKASAVHLSKKETWELQKFLVGLD